MAPGQTFIYLNAVCKTLNCDYIRNNISLKIRLVGEMLCKIICNLNYAYNTTKPSYIHHHHEASSLEEVLYVLRSA